MRRLVAVLALAGCAHAPRAAAPTADQALARFEARLFAARKVTLHVRSFAHGAVNASGEADLTVDETRVAIAGKATRDGREAAVAYGAATTPALREAVLVGMARMGALHNVLRASAGEPPDHAEGGARAWITLQDARFTFSDHTIAVRLAVDGKPVAEATLFLGDDGAPLRRLQTVHFPNGDMRVDERYRFTITP